MLGLFTLDPTDGTVQGSSLLTSNLAPPLAPKSRDAAYWWATHPIPAQQVAKGPIGACRGRGYVLGSAWTIVAGMHWGCGSIAPGSPRLHAWSPRPCPGSAAASAPGAANPQLSPVGAGKGRRLHGCVWVGGTRACRVSLLRHPETPPAAAHPLCGRWLGPGTCSTSPLPSSGSHTSVGSARISEPVWD